MKRLIDWFIDSPVAANLLMIFIIVAGALTLIGVKQEVFPNAAPDVITVSVIQPGATPEEIEEGICVKIEEQVEGLEGVKRITSTADESRGLVIIELHRDAESEAVLDDVKTRVDAISTFPDDAEKPVTVNVDFPNVVLSVVVSGRMDPATLRRTAQEVRDEIAALSEVSKVTVRGGPGYEISIEVSEDSLRRYGLSFDQVVGAVRQNSLNVSGGTVKTRGGEILLRSDTQAYLGEDFEKILLLRSPHGMRITLGDVASVVDGFEDEDRWMTLDGEPALLVTVYRVGGQSSPAVADAVFTYLGEKRARLPEGVSLNVGKDWNDLLDQRRSLMLKNGKVGLILIFVLLAIFLRLRLAFWVALGIPTALLGAVWLLPAADTTINMMTLFGFIVVLGILVDDAIVVAENIHHHSRLGKPGIQAAKDGTNEVRAPVILAVLTTIAAFVPMLSLPGWMGKFARVIPVVVICALFFSLVESLIILPRHLSHMKPPGEERKSLLLSPFAAWNVFSALVGRMLEWWIDRVYCPVLAAALRWKYLTVSIGGAALVLTVGLFLGDIMKFVFFPAIEGDQLVVSVTLPEGSPEEETRAALDRIRLSIEELRRRHEPGEPGTVFEQVMVTFGSHPTSGESMSSFFKGAPGGSNRGEVYVKLRPPEERGGVKAEDLRRELREIVGEIPGVRDIKYAVAINQQDPALSIELRSHDLGLLRKAADRVKERLADFEGTFDIADDMVAGKRECRLFVTPSAEALGITQAELARQVRQGFYGDEAQWIQRGRDDVKVMVRYPEAERRSLADLEDMRIRLPGGEEVPFGSVARVEEARGPAQIHRADGKRSVTVTSEIDSETANANEIVAAMKKDFFPGFEKEFPEIDWSFAGEQRHQAEVLMSLMKGIILAVLLIFTLLALVFRSFVQPLIVLLAIPFGMVGAVLGHLLMGLDFTMLSTIGILAMAGVVVNDSMILIDFVNRARAQGASAWEAVMQAGPRRFRAILLTSLTTFAGLMPLILETSVQAQFLIPMAVSLSFGVMFSTMVILMVVPSAYLILEDVTALLGRAGRVLGMLDPV